MLCSQCGGLDDNHTGWCDEPGREWQEYRRTGPRRIRDHIRVASSDGVWMLYEWETRGRGRKAYLISTHVRPEDAISRKQENQHIGWLYFGTSFSDAVEQWESRQKETDDE